MSWTQKHIDFGVIKLNGKRNVRVYKTSIEYTNLTIDQDVREARWGGDSVVVYLENGKVRKIWINLRL